MHDRSVHLHDRFLLRRTPMQLDQRHVCPPWRHTPIPVELFDLMTCVARCSFDTIGRDVFVVQCTTIHVRSPLSSSLRNFTILSIYDSNGRRTLSATASDQSYYQCYQSVFTYSFGTKQFSSDKKKETRLFGILLG